MARLEPEDARGVVILGSGSVSVDAAVPRERPGALLELFAPSAPFAPAAAIVADEGERCFFRASLALERGVSRVVIRPGALSEPWLLELAARADELGGELWLRDERRYTRIKSTRPPMRTEVGAPATFEVRREPTFPALPLAERHDVRCEEVAFAHGLKPVLYLVVAGSHVESLRARHGELVAMPDRVRTTVGSGEREYGTHDDAGDDVVHVFVGAEAARAAELWRDGSTRNVVELGALMGYPRCCVRAFAAMASRSVNGAFPFVTAARTRAFAAPFDARLDTTTLRLVPFVPCSYGCPEAIAWAARVAEAAGATAVPRVVLFLDEVRAVVFDRASVDADGRGASYEGASWVGAADDPLRRAFAPAGRVEGVGALLPFDRP